MDTLRKKLDPAKLVSFEGGTGSYGDDILFLYAGVADPDRRVVPDKDSDECKKHERLYSRPAIKVGVV